ncbi:hypothetical protein FXO37_25676 [Capsicum annuum]|nr:hypothetical protein FXO37_25676 [Capsicum annuum]
MKKTRLGASSPEWSPTRLESGLVVLQFEYRTPNGNSNGVSRFANSSILSSLSEIHFIFQKYQFLLEDCSREDARIWMLAKSEDVSCQFQMLARAVAVALDVLPLEEWMFLWKSNKWWSL